MFEGMRFACPAQLYHKECKMIGLFGAGVAVQPLIFDMISFGDAAGQE
jgi:hypothetical protein